MTPRNLEGAVWRKSTYSGGTNECVECSYRQGVRDSKNANGPVLAIGGQAWVNFFRDLKTDRFNR